MAPFQLLSDMRILFFRHLPNGFVAALKKFRDLPWIVKEHNLSTPNNFIIMPRDFSPELEIPYLAKTITLDERIPYMVLGKRTFYRCNAISVMRATESDLLYHMTEPGKILRSFRVIQGGKK